IRRLLAPYQSEAIPIAGDTVICDGTRVDSLTVMDMIVELEDRFDIAIPMKQVVEIRTVDHLADRLSRVFIREALSGYTRGVTRYRRMSPSQRRQMMLIGPIVPTILT